MEKSREIRKTNTHSLLIQSHIRWKNRNTLSDASSSVLLIVEIPALAPLRFVFWFLIFQTVAAFLNILFLFCDAGHDL